ncbi:MAG: pyridoxal phosphate-dependent aminotransferase [Thermocladium sp.]
MPYHGGRRYLGLVNMIDFSVNTNPIGPPNFLTPCSFLEYPDHEYKDLRHAVAEFYGIDDVVPVNGASEALSILPLIMKPSKIITVAPSYGDYEERSLALGIPHEYIFMYNDGSSFSIREMPPLGDNIMLYISNPNNPTGSGIGLTKLISIAESINGFLVVDEAYIELSTIDTVLGKGPENIVVIRSFTKSLSMPGLRIGFLYSRNDYIMKKIRTLLPSWNINSCADELVTTLLSQYGVQYRNYIEASRQYIKLGAAQLINGMKRLGLTVFETTANYLLVKSPLDAVELTRRLIREGILIRPAHTFMGLGPTYFRVAVKDKASNEVLLNAFSRIFE